MLSASRDKFQNVTWGDGDLKLWDPRKQDAIRTYTQHFDFISDFMWLQDKRHLVATRYADIFPSHHPTPLCPVIETMRLVGMAPYLSWMCAQKSRSRLHTRRIRRTNCCRLYRSKGEHASPPTPLRCISYLRAQGHKSCRRHPTRHHFHLQSQ
jgi:hypothetical protein